MNEANLIGTKEVAEMLGCSVRQIYRLITEKKILAPIEIRGLRRWKKAELLQWIDAGCPAVNEEEGE